MTKKRFKFGLAVLGGITAFLLALLALLFAPTLASADKGSGVAYGDEGKPGNPNPAFFEQVSGSENGHGGFSPAGDEAGPCGGTVNPCESDDHEAPGGDGSWNYSDGQGGQGDGHGPNNDSGNNGGQGNPPGPGGYSWIPGGGSLGGGGGGGAAPQDESKSCSPHKDDAGNKDADGKTCDKGNDGGDDSQHQNVTDNGPNDLPNDPSGDPKDDPTNNLVNNDPPGGDLPPVDPNCFPFAERCGPQEGNPTNPVLTDPPNEVPEPLTLSLFAAGLTGVAALRRRKK